MTFSFNFGDGTQENALEVEQVDTAAQVQPQRWTLAQLLAQFGQQDAEFEDVSVGSSVLQRRELQDVKHQLLFDNKMDEYHMVDNNSDLRSNVYEGGFKSWECSLDLVEKLQSFPTNEYDAVVELGCGSALPSLYLFQHYLLHGNSAGSLHLVLCDYNIEVLALVTLPNILVTWYNAKHGKCNGELEIDAAMVQQFLSSMSDLNVRIDFISGTWSTAFCSILAELLAPSKLLALGSETIYNPSMLYVYTDLLTFIHTNFKATSITAAKDIYFGVGGSVVDFIKQLSKARLQFQQEHVGTGLKRSLITILNT